jgi:formylglycine-generating enzyme
VIGLRVGVFRACSFSRWRRPLESAAHRSRLQRSKSVAAASSYLPIWARSMRRGYKSSSPTCMTWYEAYAFCIWDEGFLPSEAEREYAAAGGSQQREYPWGTTAPGNENRYAIYGCFYPSGSGTCVSPLVSTFANIAPVGTATLGAGLWGQLDLAGSLYDWTLDWYGGYVTPCTDCARLNAVAGDPVKMTPGGVFDVAPTSHLRPPSVDGARPDGRNGSMGIRCGRNP